MISQRMFKALGVGITVFTGLMLLGITKAFDLVPETNLFQTGVTPSLILGISLLVVGWGIYRNRI